MEPTALSYEHLLWLSLTSDILHCSGCKKVLKPPIFLVKERGNLCDECYNQILEGDVEEEDEELPLTIENKALSKLLEKLYFQCRFNKEGCEEQLNYSNMLDHVKVCPHRIISCPCANCKWSGKLVHLDAHFYDACPGVVGCLHLKDKVGVLEGDLASDDVIGVVYSAQGTFTLRLKIVDNKAYLLAYCSTVGAEIFVDVRFSKYCPDEKKHIEMKNKVSCRAVNNMEQFFSFDITKAITLSGDIGRQPQENPFTILIAAKEVKEDWHIIKKKQLNALLCVSCKNYLKPPIYNCTTGCSVCNTCYEKKNAGGNGESLRKTYTNVRNSLLEELTSYITYPCKFCDFDFVLETQHELTCRYQKWSCVADDCKYSGIWPDLKSHLIQGHPDSVFFENTSDFAVGKASWFFITYDTIFNVVYVFVHDEFFTCEMSAISIRSDVKFNFEVSFTSEGKTVAFIWPCYFVGDRGSKLEVQDHTLKDTFGDIKPKVFQLKIMENKRT